MDQNYNPEDIIAREGRFAPRALTRWPVVSVANVDLDILRDLLTTVIYNAVRDHPPLRHQYQGTFTEVSALIEGDIDHLIDQALFETWNRLRIVAETYSIPTRNERFPRKAPSFDGFVLPRFIASLLSAIGPLRVTDTLRDTTIIYAPLAAAAANYGRGQPAHPDGLRVMRIIHAMRAANIPLSSIQFRGSQGSFFTTAFLRVSDIDRSEVIGTMHHSHYTRNDVVMAMMFGEPDEEENPFEDMSITLGFVSDEAVITPFMDLPAPEANMLGPEETRPVGGTFDINNRGLAPPANVPVNGRGQGIYVLGRGGEAFFTCSLARDLSNIEIASIFRYRLLHGGPDNAAAAHPAAIGANAPVNPAA